MMEMVMTLTVVAVELWRGWSDFWQWNDAFVVFYPSSARTLTVTITNGNIPVAFREHATNSDF
jgi:hypothetical protein